SGIKEPDQVGHGRQSTKTKHLSKQDCGSPQQPKTSGTHRIRKQLTESASGEASTPHPRRARHKPATVPRNGCDVASYAQATNHSGVLNTTGNGRADFPWLRARTLRSHS